MKHDRLLTITSLLSIILSSFHIADDIVRGYEKGNLGNTPAFPMLAVWLYGTVVLAGRRSGYIIMLLGAILGVGMPILHMRGRGLNVAVAGTSGGLFFVWTIMALGVVALFSLILRCVASGACRGAGASRPTTPNMRTMACRQF